MAAPMQNQEIKARVDILSASKGRGLVAVQDIFNGDVILEERPLVSSQYLWNALYKYEACNYCMKSLETAERMARRLTGNPALELPYRQCCTSNSDNYVCCGRCGVRYCSKDCHDLAYQQYHQCLCLGEKVNDPEHPINKLQEMWRMIHFPPETVSIMVIVRMLCLIKQSVNKSEILSILDTFCHTTINEQEHIEHKLLSDQYRDQIDVLRCAIKECFYIDEVKDLFTPGGFRSVLAMLGTNGQGIGSSSLSVWEKNLDKLELSPDKKQELETFLDNLYEDMDKESGSFLTCEGTGLYSTQSACNHSCTPNAECTFPYNNNTLVLKAIQDIKTGQEICTCYLDECMVSRSRHSRQKYLRENYLFSCKCVKCESQKEEPDVSSEEEEYDEEDENMDAS